MASTHPRVLRAHGGVGDAAEEGWLVGDRRVVGSVKGVETETDKEIVLEVGM